METPSPPEPRLRLTPDHSALLLTIPTAAGELRDITLTPTAEGMRLLFDILLRQSGASRPAERLAKVQAQSPWPVGAEVRFVPPSPSPWRDAKFWTPGADAALGRVVAQRQGRTGEELYVVVDFAPCGHFAVPARHLRLAARKFTAQGKEQVTLEDLGL